MIRFRRASLVFAAALAGSGAAFASDVATVPAGVEVAPHEDGALARRLAELHMRATPAQYAADAIHASPALAAACETSSVIDIEPMNAATFRP
ncbi:hypothetical protein U0E23_11695 [Burkholderia stagnalis]|uniref:hypothetical protein n=1 Tax=Burkholderia stagnalis TaxID=1503054 RepID=UPI002AB50C61|nr:hypothetical protein [Burkholderia stagnalis]MDY7803117.1 hypothetical protein [Burkholderia stagnalis]